MGQWKLIGAIVFGSLILGMIVVGFSIVGTELFRMANRDRSGVRAGGPTSGEDPGAHDERKPSRDHAATVGHSDAEPILAQVVGPDNAPLAGVSVELARSGNPPFEVLLTAETDAGGLAEFLELSLERYAIHLDHPPFYPQAAAQVMPGEQLLFRLAKGTPLGGQITDASTGEPLEGARVLGTTRALDPVRWNEAVVSDAEGRYLFRSVPAEPLTIHFVREGYQSHSEREYRVAPGGPALDVALSAGLPVTGWVLDAQTGQPVAGASISVGFGFFEQAEIAETDQRGVFTLRGLGREKIVIRARAKGYAPGKVIIDLRGVRGESTVQIDLERWTTLSGVVRSPRGEPVQGAEVFLEEEALFFARKSGRIATTDHEGRFRARLEDVQGKIRLMAKHPDHTVGYSGDVYVTPGEGVEAVEILLPKGGTVSGIVVDEHGSAVEGAKVSLFDEILPNLGNPAHREDGPYAHQPRGKLTHSARSSAEGAFEFRGVVAGMKFLQVRATGLLTRSIRRIAVAENGVVGPLTITLELGKTIAGQVLDTNGAPVEGARVSAVRRAGDRERATGAAVTDASGEFSLEDLGGGSYDVFASKTGFVTGNSLQVPAGTRKLVMTMQRHGGIAGFVTFSAMVDTVLPGKFAAWLRTYETEPKIVTRKSFSAREGKFYFDSVAPGVYELIVSAEGFLPTSIAPLSVSQDQVTGGIQAILDTGAFVHGRVLDQDGYGVSDATVVARSLGGSDRSGPQSGGHATTGPDGRYLISGLAEGHYEVHATATALTLNAPSRVQVADRGQAVVDLTMIRGVELRIRVVDPDGEPLPGALVEIVGERGNPIVNPKSLSIASRYADDPRGLRQALGKLNQTDVTGFLLVSPIPAGVVEVRVRLQGYGTARQKVRLAAGETARVVLTPELR